MEAARHSEDESSDPADRGERVLELKQLATNGHLLVVGLMLEDVELTNQVLHDIGDVAAES